MATAMCQVAGNDGAKETTRKRDFLSQEGKIVL